MTRSNGKMPIKDFMSQVKTSDPEQMTDPQLDRCLASLLQYIPLSNGWDSYHKQYGFIPMWSVDPAASLEVQAKAIEVNADRYVTKLVEIVEGEIFWSSDGKLDPIAVAWILIATPRQRAEAAYLTLSQREDV